MDDIQDDALLEAIRRRAKMLRELQHEIGGQGGGGGASHIENNVYGGGLGGGVSESLGNAEDISPEERDYFVDILREDTDNGWHKKVHRYTQPRGDEGGGVTIPPSQFKKKIL